MPRFRFVVRGVVQGVGFRAATRRAALQLGVVGCVRNRPDGAVEGEAAAAPAALAAFRAWLAQGPPSARVHEVVWEAVAERPDEGAFAIER